VQVALRRKSLLLILLTSGGAILGCSALSAVLYSLQSSRAGRSPLTSSHQGGPPVQGASSPSPLAGNPSPDRSHPMLNPVGTERVKCYVPPIGVPVPSFGIDQSHWMYASPECTYDYGNGPEPYRLWENGPYTHYVDVSAWSATDRDNPLGTPRRPRRTVPSYLPPGSVVEIHGTYGSNWVIEADGTEEAPVFIRGPGKSERPVLTANASVRGRYVIWENILQVGQRSFSVSPYRSAVPHHVSIRNCELRGEGRLSSGVGMIVHGETNLDVHDVVLYRNHIYKQGDSEAETSTDRHGIAVTRHANNVWVLENHVHHSQADAIQVNGWANETTHHIYIARNIFHDDGENAIDVKEASHVIVSQNVMYGYEHSEGAAVNAHRDDGQIVGPENVWVLCNHIHHAYDGIVSMGIKGDFYAIGNVIHDVTDAGLKSWSEGTRHFINNTIRNAKRCIAHAGSARANIVNNIVCNARGLHIYLPDASKSSTFHHNLLHQPGGSLVIRWGGSTYSDISSFLASAHQGSGCVQGDPRFLSVARNDYRLPPDGLAVDSGVERDRYTARFASLYGLDIDVDYRGLALPQGSATDIGAIETERESSPPETARQ